MHVTVSTECAGEPPVATKENKSMYVMLMCVHEFMSKSLRSV